MSSSSEEEIPESEVRIRDSESESAESEVEVTDTEEPEPDPDAETDPGPEPESDDEPEVREDEVSTDPDAEMESDVAEINPVTESDVAELNPEPESDAAEINSGPEFGATETISEAERKGESNLPETSGPPEPTEGSSQWQHLRVDLDDLRPRVSEDASHSGDLESHCQELEAIVDRLKNDLEEKSRNEKIEAQHLQKVQTELQALAENYDRLEETNQTLTSQNDQLVQKVDRLSSECNDLSELCQKKQNFVDRIAREHRSNEEELLHARAAKTEMLVQIETLESRELSIQYREKRIAEERELMEQRIASMGEDLRAVQDELVDVKRDKIDKTGRMQRELNEKNDAIRVLERKVESLEETNEHLGERLDDVLGRLKEARNAITSTEQAFRQEVRAQTKLADIYKARSDDQAEKCCELQKAVESLQSLLKEASDRYGSLEEESGRDKSDLKEELRRRNDAIRALKKELDNANTLIETLKKNDLADKGIAQLSPAAAIASKLVNSGLNLTQVYTQLVSCEEELMTTKDENSRLNAYIEQILKEIEERAPELKRQRDDYVDAMENVDSLKELLEQEQMSNQSFRTEAERTSTRMATLARENERLKKQVDDLGKQVTVLVREVESARFGGRPIPDSPQATESGGTDADSVITRRLVTFRDVMELQERNIQLLSVVREMSADQERNDSKFVDSRTQDLRQELEAVNIQLKELTESRKKQEQMVETLIEQRDMFKSLLDEKSDMTSKTPPRPKMTSTPGTFASPGSGSKTVSLELESKLANAESLLQMTQKNLEETKAAKEKTEKELVEKIEKLRDEVGEARAKAIKLASQEEYNTERFKIAQTNQMNQAKELNNLRSTNESLKVTIGKHERSLQLLETQISEAQTKLKRKDGEFNRLQQEIERYKNLETRLVSKISALQQQNAGTKVIADNLNKFEKQLHENQNEEKQHLQSTNQFLSKEVSLLRKRLEQEEDNFKSSVKAWQASQEQLRLQLEEMKEKESALLNNLNEMSHELEKVRQQSPVNLDKPGEHSFEAPTTAELQSQVRSLKLETVNLKEHLSSARDTATKYKDLAAAAEGNLMENASRTRSVIEDFELKLSSINDAKQSLETKVEQLAREREHLMAQVQELESRSDPVEEMRVELLKAEAELAKVSEALEEEKEESKKYQNKIEKLVSELESLGRRFEDESFQHGQTTSQLIELRKREKYFDEQIVELQTQKKRAEETLADLQSQLSEVEEKSSADCDLLRRELEVLTSENSSLHESLANLTHQMSAINKSGTNLDVSLVGNESTDQLMDLVKYLRREKEILSAKMLMLQTEVSGLKSKLELSQAESAETRSALALALEKAHAEVLSSSQYTQLLERVEAIPALKENNRSLQMTNEKLMTELKATSEKLDEATKSLEPLQQKLKAIEESSEKTEVEIEGLRADNQRWRQRANQLIEKNHKINPDELKRLEGENSKLSNQVKQLSNLSNNLTNKVKITEEKFASTTKAKEVEIHKLKEDIQTSQKLNQQMGQRFNLINKKLSEHESTIKTLQTERDILKSELESAIGELQTNSKNKIDNESITKQLQEKTAKVLELEGQVKEKDVLINSSKVQINKLKALGRTFKDKFEKSEQENGEKATLVQQLQDELKKAKEVASASPPANVASAASAEITETGSVTSANDEKLAEAESLIERSAMRINDLESEIKKLNEDIVKIQDEKTKLQEVTNKTIKKEERAKLVLVQAKEKITHLTTEVERLNQMKGDEAATALKAEKDKLAERLDACERQRSELSSLVEALKSQMKKLSEDAETEKKSLHLQLEQMAKNQSQSSHSSADKSDKSVTETVTASVKPVMATGGTSAQRKSTVQPQAHIQPTRHAPAQTATMVVRPTAMRTTSVVRATPQNDAQPQMSVVQPIISSVIPMTSTMNQDNRENNDDLPRAMVQPRQTSEEPSPVAGPSRAVEPTSAPASTSTSATAPVSMVTVAPTQKRSRENLDAENDAKKARIVEELLEQETSANVEPEDDLVVLDSSDDEIETEEVVYDAEPEDEFDTQIDDEGPTDDVIADEDGDDDDDNDDDVDLDAEDEQASQEDEILIIDSDGEQEEDTLSRDASSAVVPELSQRSSNQQTSASETQADNTASESGDRVVPSSTDETEFHSTQEDQPTTSDDIAALGLASQQDVGNTSVELMTDLTSSAEGSYSNVTSPQSVEQIDVVTGEGNQEEDSEPQVGEPISVLSGFRGVRASRMLSRTPIVWNASPDATTNSMRGRSGGTARRSGGRGPHMGRRGSGPPRGQP